MVVDGTLPQAIIGSCKFARGERVVGFGVAESGRYLHMVLQ